jgi:hypothetical protein
MPKMIYGGDNADQPDWAGMEDEEYGEDAYSDYTGPMAPKNTVLNGEIKKSWVTTSANGNYMHKVLFEAGNNTGDKAKFNGMPIWENVVWVPSAKFKWQPYLDACGLSLKMVQRATYVADEDDNVGKPILKIHKIEFPIEVRVITGVDTYEGDKRNTVSKWLQAEEAEEDDDLDDDDTEAPF